MMEINLSNFFSQMNANGEYRYITKGNSGFIIPRKEDEYYKPTIIIKRLDELEKITKEYLKVASEFYQQTDKLQLKHDYNYFLNHLFYNMTNSDATDLNEYVKKRISFFKDQHLKEYNILSLLISNKDYCIYCKRDISNLGFESPYILKFKIEMNGQSYDLPLIRYAIDDHNRCHIFAIQFERTVKRDNKKEEYKSVVNSINSGIKKYRNVEPSFVLVFKLFIDLLSKEGIQDILVPDYLFSRYRNYYGAKTVKKSDQILERILDHYILLLQRMEYQYKEFDISSYPNEIDSFTHISLNKKRKK